MCRMFGAHGAATDFDEGSAWRGSFSVVWWASLLTSSNVRPELGDRRSCGHDLKTTTTWWRSRGGYLAYRLSSAWQQLVCVGYRWG